MELADALIALAHLEEAHAELTAAVPYSACEEAPVEDVSHYLDHALDPLRARVNGSGAGPGPRLCRRLMEIHDYVVVVQPLAEPGHEHLRRAALRIRQAVELLSAATPADA